MLLIGLLSAGCNPDDDEPATPAGNGGGGGGGNTTITATTVESVTFTQDGTTRTYTSGANNVGIVFSNSGSSGSTSTKNYGCSFYNTVTDDTYIEFILGDFEQAGFGIPSEELFFGWFSTGEVDYSTGESQVEKAEVMMNDGAPLYTQWSSRCGAQSGESFNVTQVVQIPGGFSYDKVKYRVTFNCKLYNCNTSAVRTITNGTAVVLVESNI